MNSNWLTILRSGVSIARGSLAGKKRWVSLLGYALLAIASVLGFPLDDLVRSLATDPAIDKDSTLIAIGLAAVTTFRFFQNMGANRDSAAQIEEITEKLDRNGVR